MITEFLPNRKYKFIGKKNLPWYVSDCAIRDLLQREVRCIKQLKAVSSETIVTVIFEEIQYPVSFIREDLSDFILIEELVQEEFDV